MYSQLGDWLGDPIFTFSDPRVPVRNLHFGEFVGSCLKIDRRGGDPTDPGGDIDRWIFTGALEILVYASCSLATSHAVIELGLPRGAICWLPPGACALQALRAQPESSGHHVAPPHLLRYVRKGAEDVC